MDDSKYIKIISNRKQVVLNIASILYVQMSGKNSEIHTVKSKIYKTRMSISQLHAMLGEDFIEVYRGCIVSAMAIHEITDKIELLNGEALEYTKRKKSQIIDQFRYIQKRIVNSFSDDNIPSTKEEYCKYYSSFDKLPFAFTDIEMIFDEEKHAVDWIFRYGNYALAEIEKMPLDKLIGNSFGSLFSNMDSKWLRTYERATLYGETLEIIDYSPEIDTYLKIISFPTFKGHCGCILFDISNIELTQNSDDAPKALELYLNGFSKSI
ncbi:LytTR family DNA-binding domain-containing protein [uncultured Eubacterium sp.]|uniref:LytTR family DNA-binding domain-containing protein n=1 Tax=uncultured Eubacterium sp. TaxID=165185 RepID=UPI002804581B|nr:LytTR family DNA-binding domain-containing protein [uncultured Eubacterium sp.]